jgi:16S rRNA (adenine1518-N6/adenine1519-N6)-dimethyltransferase
MPASWLADPHETREVLDRFGLATKHRLGQNFLVDDRVVARILDLAQVGENDVVLEVGPGIGTLTVALLARASVVCSIEADRELEGVLAETCSRCPGRLALVMGDALRVGENDVRAALADAGVDAAPRLFVSNLPYQVATAVIMRVLIEVPSVERLVVMVQAEVADRISASPGSREYGAYTARLALYGQVTGRFEVAPSCFTPQPRVNSAVVRIDRLADQPLSADELSATTDVIGAAFAQRRKTIRNSMSSSGYDRAALDVAFSACGIDPTARAETLAPEQFVSLASALS